MTEEEEAYREFINSGEGDTREEFEDAYQGHWGSLEDFVWSLIEDVYTAEYEQLKILVDKLSLHPLDDDALDMTAWGCDYWITSQGFVFRNL